MSLRISSGPSSGSHVLHGLPRSPFSTFSLSLLSPHLYTSSLSSSCCPRSPESSGLRTFTLRALLIECSIPSYCIADPALLQPLILGHMPKHYSPDFSLKGEPSHTFSVSRLFHFCLILHPHNNSHIRHTLDSILFFCLLVFQ